MTAVENLVEETRKLCGYSLKSFEEGFKELSEIEKTIKILIDISLNLQQQLSNLIISKMEPSFPNDEDKNETSTSKDEPNSIQNINNYNLNLGLVSTYSLVEDLTVERDQLISEKNSALNRSIDLFGEVEKKLKHKEMSKVLDVEEPSDKIHHFSEIVGDTSKSLITEISEAYKNTDIASLNDILARTLHLGGGINDVSAEAYVGDTIQSSNKVFYFNEALENISKTLHQSISKTHEITDVSVLNKIPRRTSQPVELKTSKKEPTLFSDQGVFEIPALKPRKKLLTPSDDAIANTARLSNAIEIGSHERETIPNSKETISYPFATSATSAASSQLVSAPSIHVSNAFETISNFITTVTGIDRQINGVMGQGGIDVNKVLRQSHPLDKMLSEKKRAALDLHKIALENSGTIQGMQIMDSCLSMAPTEALERARLSALNNISLTFHQEKDYRIPFPSMTPPTMENILQIISGSQREPMEGYTDTKSVNFQNTFNIVVNVKNSGKETELRDLGKKIGQVLSDEIRRYGGIR